MRYFLHLKERIKGFIREALGIPSSDEMRGIHKKLQYLEAENLALKREVAEIEQVNIIIQRHLKFLNDEFVVAADISGSKHDPSVVLILQKNGRKEIKTYNFKQGTMEEIYRFVEGFGNSVQFDMPPNAYFPKFRW
jgi:hypothetical protein